MIIIGCHDGYLRAYDPTAKSDEGGGDESVVIDTYVFYPPMALAPPEHKGKILRTVITTGGGASDTDGVDYDIYVGDIVRAILDKTNDPVITGTITGTNRKEIREKSSGQFAAVYFSNDTVDESFSIEAVVIDVIPAGKLKQ